MEHGSYAFSGPDPSFGIHGAEHPADERRTPFRSPGTPAAELSDPSGSPGPTSPRRCHPAGPQGMGRSVRPEMALHPWWRPGGTARQQDRNAQRSADSSRSDRRRPPGCDRKNQGASRPRADRLDGRTSNRLGHPSLATQESRSLSRSSSSAGRAMRTEAEGAAQDTSHSRVQGATAQDQEAAI